MKFGLKHIFKPNAVKFNNVANLLLAGCGAGGVISSLLNNPHLTSVIVCIGLIFKGIAVFSADDSNKLQDK